jgi:hypothetical protein
MAEAEHNPETQATPEAHADRGSGYVLALVDYGTGQVSISQGNVTVDEFAEIADLLQKQARAYVRDAAQRATQEIMLQAFQSQDRQEEQETPKASNGKVSEEALAGAGGE